MELIRLIEAAIGTPARIKHHPFQRGDMEITFADIRRARELLGYSPSTPIAEGIRKFVEWFVLEDPR
jgi:UDP-glucuronate 4-epimerase